MKNLEEHLRKYLTENDIPLYLRIYQGILDFAKTIEEDAVYRLPSIRKLAKCLKINNGTVARAYGKLEEEGTVYTKIGSGTFIRIPKRSDSYLSYTSKDIDKNIFKNELCKENVSIIDLASSTPSSVFFPVESFKNAINKVLDRDGGKAFEYSGEKGFYPLRQRICEYISEIDICATPDDVLITTGAQQGIDLITKALIGRDDVIYTERPTYNGAAASFISRGAILVDIPMDKEGMDANILENMVKKKRPRFVYIMPNFQSPTGISYTIKRRKEILQLADRYDFLLVEEDYLGELRFSNSIPSIHLKSLDKNNRVIYIKSFSKLFMPGLRLGFMILPQQIQKKIQDAKWYSDISTSALTQRAFEVYLRSGEWKIHLDELKKIYSIRHNIMANTLNHYKDLFKFTPPQGGLTFWVSIVGEKSSFNIAAQAWKNGVKIKPGYHFYINKNDTQNIRLGYAAANTNEIKEGIERIVFSIRK